MRTSRLNRTNGDAEDFFHFFFFTLLSFFLPLDIVLNKQKFSIRQQLIFDLMRSKKDFHGRKLRNVGDNLKPLWTWQEPFAMWFIPNLLWAKTTSSRIYKRSRPSQHLLRKIVSCWQFDWAIFTWKNVIHNLPSAVSQYLVTRLQLFLFHFCLLKFFVKAHIFIK